jgi:hydrogenase maturation protease
MMIIGLGNEFRHDDAVGIIAVRLLHELGVPAEEHDSDPATLIDRWNGADRLVLIDAVCSGAHPGLIHCLDVSRSPLPRDLFKRSTHAVGLADAIELSRELGTLPDHVFVFGIEAGDFTDGVGLSPEVERALPVLVKAVSDLHNPPRGSVAKLLYQSKK